MTDDARFARVLAGARVTGQLTMDGATRVRAEDAFDVEAAAHWLEEHATEPHRSRLGGTPQVRQFSGGASNLTYLLHYPRVDLVLRRAPRGTKARGAHDMGREFGIQSRLKPVFPYVADMVGFCADEAVIGSPFYVMERLDGFIPRGNLPEDALTPEQARRLCLAMVDVLAELHSVDPAAAGLHHELGKGLGYVRRQVEGWSSRYRDARTDDAPALEEVMGWLAANRPEDVRTCVIHNDFKMDNLVLSREDPSRVVGILDWEMATLGDPLMDLGGDLAFWVEAADTDLAGFRRVPTHLPGMISRREFVDRYCDRMALTVTPEQWRFYEVFGLFRLAVISQQIYYRFVHGQTTNRAFARFGAAVHVVDRRIGRLLGWAGS